MAERGSKRVGRLQLPGWAYVVAAVLAGLALLVALTPMLLSTPAGNKLLLRALNGRIEGRLAIERIAVGWWSGMEARGLVLDDAEGKRLLDAPSLATELSLLDLFRDPKPLGATTIQVRRLDVVSYPDDTNNVTRALGLGPMTSGRGGTGLPFLGDVEFKIHELSWRGSGSSTVRAHDSSGRLRIEGRRGRVSADVSSTLDAAEIGATPLRAHFVGDVDAHKGVLSVTEPSVLEEGREAGNRLEIAPGSRLSWGKEESQLKLVVRYDLRRLTVLLSPLMPSWLHLSGRHSAEVRVRGEIAAGKGLQRLRRIQVEPTSFAFDRIQIHGLTLTDGRLPIRLSNGVLSFDDAELASNGGVIVLAGRIDLNGAEPRYLLDSPQVVARNIGLNESLAVGPLSFLPFSWGRPSKMKGQATVRLERASLPLSISGMTREGSLAGHLLIRNLESAPPAVRAIAGSLGKVASLGKSSLEVHSAEVDVPFTLSEGRVNFQSVNATAGPLGLSFTGSVGLDGTIDATSKVRVAAIPLPASVAVTGTVQEPKIKVLAGIGSPLKGLPGLLDKLHLPGG